MYHLSPILMQGVSEYPDVFLMALLHRALNDDVVENTAAGALFVAHSGECPGEQNVPVVPTAARSPSMTV